MPSSGETSEDIAIASSVDKSGFLLGGGLNVVFPHEELQSAFIAIELSYGTPHNALAKRAQGKSVVHLYNEDLKQVSISFPSTDEQAKISSFFDNIDNLITLHLREFTKSNSSIFVSVSIYANGLPAAWELRKVGELLVERNEQAPMSEEYPLMAFIANEGVAPKGDRYDRSSLVSDTENKVYKKTDFGDFIYSSNNLETGSIGLNKFGKASISPVYSIFQPTGIADSDFLGRRLVRKDFINAMVKWRQGVIYGQWRIHESDFVKIEIPVPTVEEQRQIGAFLDSLDNLITLHLRKYSELFL